MNFETPKLDALINSQESIAKSLQNLELYALGIGILLMAGLCIKLFKVAQNRKDK